jgi:hypothetical protein
LSYASSYTTVGVSLLESKEHGTHSIVSPSTIPILSNSQHGISSPFGFSSVLKNQKEVRPWPKIELNG